MRLSKPPETKGGAVNAAFREYIRRKHVQELIDSWGRIIVDDYGDHALGLEEEKRTAQTTGRR